MSWLGPSGVRSARQRRATLFGLLLVAGVARSVRADSSENAGTARQTLVLNWTGPGPELTCLGEEGLMHAVNEYLGRDAFAITGAVEFVLTVRVERSPDRTWRAVLELSDASGRTLGSRELTSTSELCSSLDEPLVLTVALMVDSEPVPAPVPSVQAPEPEPALEPAPPPSEPPPAPYRWKLHADASMALEAGLLPAPRPGLDLGLELRAASWLSTRLALFGFLPAEVGLPGGAAARFSLLGGTLELCPGVGAPDSYRLSLCLGPLYGVIIAKSSGLQGAHRTGQALLAAAFGLRAVAPVAGHWSGVAELSGVVPYRPDRFVYQVEGGSRELFQVSSVSLIATVGASVMF